MSGRRAGGGTFECPNCGAEVRVGAKVCRECGSDEGTGWQSSEEIEYRSVDVPEGYGGEVDRVGDGEAERPLWFRLAVILIVIALVVWLALT